MQSKFLKATQQFPLIYQHQHHHKAYFNAVACANNSSSDNKNGFKILGKTLGDYRTKLSDLDKSEYMVFVLSSFASIMFLACGFCLFFVYVLNLSSGSVKTLSNSAIPW